MLYLVLLPIAVLPPPAPHTPKRIITIDTHGSCLPNHEFFKNMFLSEMLDLLLSILSKMGKKGKRNIERKERKREIEVFFLNGLRSYQEKDMVCHIFGLQKISEICVLYKIKYILQLAAFSRDHEFKLF